MNFVNVQNLSKDYYTKDGVINAVQNFSLRINQGDIIALVGPSGCGKSTILSILAGITDKSSGHIEFSKNNFIIGYMQQDDTLFDWLNIEQNSKLALKLNKKNNQYLNQHVNKLIKNYGLDEYQNLYPKNISGGMRQRVALIRTLALNPDILLLDEPFSALDYQTRLLVSKDLLTIIRNEKQTVILVTHDIAEAISMADKVITLSNRPANIKNIYEINLSSKYDPLLNRTNPGFPVYFEKIWGDLNE